MLRAFAILHLLLVACGNAFAQRGSIDPPVNGRPIDFSNVVGKYDLKVTAAPTDVRVEEPIALRVLITGEGPAKYEPKRKHLQLFPAAFERDFYVLPMPEEDRVDKNANTWLFVYRLKAKHAKIDVIDGLKLVVYNPDHPGKIKFVSHFADPIDIKVKPRGDKPTDPILEVQTAPDSFYVVADAQEILARPTTWTMAPWQFALVVALPPILCFVGVWAGRRLFPSDARRVRQFRNAAARRALDRLQADDATAWDVVHQYLQERFDFAALDPTPTEVAAFLKQRGFAKSVCEMSRTFYQECDAARFAKTERSPRLAEEATRLIQSLEADPCA